MPDGPRSARLADAGLRVALPLPLPRLFDYLPARRAHGRDAATVGAPGAGAVRQRASWSAWSPAWARRQPTRPDLQAAVALLDPAPLLHGELLDSLRWLARYTHAPLGEVLATALPAPLRRGEPLPDTHAWAWQLTEAGAHRAATRCARQAAAARRAAAPAAPATKTRSTTPTATDWRSAARALAKRGLVERIAVPARRRRAPAPQPGPALNAEQQAAVDAVAGDARRLRARCCSTASPAAARPRSTCTRSPTAWRAAGRRWCWCRRSA